MKQFTEMKFGGAPNRDDDWDVKISVRNDGSRSTQELIQSALVELCRGGDPTFPLTLAHEVAKETVSSQLRIEPGGDTVGVFPDSEVAIVLPGGFISQFRHLDEKQAEKAVERGVGMVVNLSKDEVTAFSSAADPRQWAHRENG